MCRLYYIMLNKISVGVTFFEDLSYRNYYNAFVRMMNGLGFFDPNEYVESIPGYTDKDVILYKCENKGDYVYFTINTNNRNSSFEVTLGNFSFPSSFTCYLLNDFIYTMSGNDDCVFILRPTIAQCEKLDGSFNPKKITDYSKLWFCEDWKENA